MIRKIGFAGIVAIFLLAVGCAPSTRVTFHGPPGAVMFVDDKPYHLPAQVELVRPGGTSGSKRYPVSLVFTAADRRDVRAKGQIEVFGFNESDVDRAANNTCDLDETQLVKILNGTVVIFKGQSASRQPIYDLTLGPK